MRAAVLPTRALSRGQMHRLAWLVMSADRGQTLPAATISRPPAPLEQVACQGLTLMTIRMAPGSSTWRENLTR
jgi:hypothetical protein